MDAQQGAAVERRQNVGQTDIGGTWSLGPGVGRPFGLVLPYYVTTNPGTQKAMDRMVRSCVSVRVSEEETPSSSAPSNEYKHDALSPSLPVPFLVYITIQTTQSFHIQHSSHTKVFSLVDFNSRWLPHPS